MSDGKLTDKPADALRKKLESRSKKQMQIVAAMNSSNKVDTYGILNKPSPSEKRSKAWKKKLRTRDDYRISDTFKEPEVVKGE